MSVAENGIRYLLSVFCLAAAGWTVAAEGGGSVAAVSLSGWKGEAISSRHEITNATDAAVVCPPAELGLTFRIQTRQGDNRL